jgi:hypothetical protein
MSSLQRFGRHTMAGSLIIVLVAAPAAAEEIRGWRCEAPLTERFDPVQVWSSALAELFARGLAPGSGRP